ncbi:MAG TPA: hypothetical protein VG941_01240 [Candidatus Paceibacterota bacterium]|nr:hypothetical protein [Candidatus Paceibacterota bacterium]
MAIRGRYASAISGSPILRADTTRTLSVPVLTKLGPTKKSRLIGEIPLGPGITLKAFHLTTEPLRPNGPTEFVRITKTEQVERVHQGTLQRFAIPELVTIPFPLMPNVVSALRRFTPLGPDTMLAILSEHRLAGWRIAIRRDRSRLIILKEVTAASSRSIVSETGQGDTSRVVVPTTAVERFRIIMETWNTPLPAAI